jgi:hypothetical protein
MPTLKGPAEEELRRNDLNALIPVLQVLRPSIAMILVSIRVSETILFGR